MSDVVKRLAKRAEVERYPCPVEGTKCLVMPPIRDAAYRQKVAPELARWWLNAIADEVDSLEVTDSRVWGGSNPRRAAKWLRTQASDR